MGVIYKVKGTTGDVTTCELCGRDELKGTVVLQPLDADGNADGDPCYFGTGCAAKAAGWTQRQVTTHIKAAIAAERERQAAERTAALEKQRAFVTQWYQEHYGTPDLREAAKIAGISPVRLSGQAITEYCARQAVTA
jgi:hypothetical protein